MQQQSTSSLGRRTANTEYKAKSLDCQSDELTVRPGSFASHFSFSWINFLHLAKTSKPICLAPEQAHQRNMLFSKNIPQWNSSLKQSIVFFMWKHHYPELPASISPPNLLNKSSPCLTPSPWSPPSHLTAALPRPLRLVCSSSILMFLISPMETIRLPLPPWMMRGELGAVPDTKRAQDKNT